MTASIYSRSLFGRIERKVIRSAYHRINRVSDYVETVSQEVYLRRMGLEHASRIKTYTTRDELKILFRLAAWLPSGSGILEIGSYTGASACYLGAGVSQVGGHLYCVDTWNNETMPEGTRDTFSEFRQNTRSIEHLITIIRKRSDEIEEKDFNHTIRLAFIDGDHGYEQVAGDFAKVDSIISEDGIIAFHDCIMYKGVSCFIGDLLSGGEWMLIGHLGNLLWMKKAQWWNAS
jgi:predicted O-methyltransferase YrrM